MTDVGSGKTAGTFSDTGDGTSDALKMYLMFNPVTLPVSSANLTFAFTDLDLKYWNDPTGFLESVQFFSSDGTALTGAINSKNSSGGGTLSYTITGNSTYQTIYFPDVTSILQNPFYVELDFSSKYYTVRAEHSRDPDCHAANHARRSGARHPGASRGRTGRPGDPAESAEARIELLRDQELPQAAL